jgi:uncharacterized protein YkwD
LLPFSRKTDARARSLRHLAALVALAALTAWPAASAQAGDDSGRPQAAAAGAARFGPALLAELNRVRTARGLPAVVVDRRMSRTAAAHSRDMARRGYFAHGSWGSRVARAAGHPRSVGETIGWRMRDRPEREARQIVGGWLRSGPHRAVLLDGRFQRVGIGRASGRIDGLGAALYTVDWATAR